MLKSKKGESRRVGKVSEDSVVSVKIEVEDWKVSDISEMQIRNVNQCGLEIVQEILKF